MCVDSPWNIFAHTTPFEWKGNEANRRLRSRRSLRDLQDISAEISE